MLDVTNKITIAQTERTNLILDNQNIYLDGGELLLCNLTSILYSTQYIESGISLYYIQRRNIKFKTSNINVQEEFNQTKILDK
jgi:hypothetical protein